MSENWQAGDLALYVSNSHKDDEFALWADWKPKKGGVYTVERVAYVQAQNPGIGLFLVEDTCFTPNAAWDARDFRKVTPPEADEFDRETIELMRGKPVEVV